MTIRQPRDFSKTLALSKWVRDELLTPELVINPKLTLVAHRQLEVAINDGVLPYLVRKQGSTGDTSFRGKETALSSVERKLVFTDNSPPIWLHQNLLSASQSKSIGPDLHAALRARKVPASHSYKRIETDLSPEWPTLGASMRAYPSIWKAGWKLSHILACSPQSDQDPLSDLRKQDPTRYYRMRFLRNLSPFNYFLTPMKKRFKMLINGKAPRQNDLGEAPEVIAWVIKILAEEIFAPAPEVLKAFEQFLYEAGLGFGYTAGTNLPDGEVTVSTKNMEETQPTASDDQARSSIVRRIAIQPRSPATELPDNDYKIYQVNQGLSQETGCDFLVAPNGSHGGWTPMLRLNEGDVILHANNKRIVAISVVEPFDFRDHRYDAYRDRVDNEDELSSTCLTYTGQHLTMDDPKLQVYTQYNTVMVSTSHTGLTLEKVSKFYGYMVNIAHNKLSDRPDLLMHIEEARVAYSAMTDLEEAS